MTDRSVSYGRIDPELSRELFIRRALVEGDWETRHAFVRRNAEAWPRSSELEEKARRRDLLVDDEVVFDHYDQRIPAEVVSGRALRRVVEEGSPGTAAPADLSPEQLIDSAVAGSVTEDYPSTGSRAAA